MEPGEGHYYLPNEKVTYQKIKDALEHFKFI